MKVKVVIHKAQCLARFDPRYRRAQEYLDNEVIKDCAPFTPFRSGNLMDSASRGTVIGSGEVEWNAPYSKPVYYADKANFSKDKHPQACAQWFEKAKAVKKDTWVNGVNTIIKE